MHASFIVERSRRVRKMPPFPRFWRKLCVISILLEIFRRLNAIFIAFITPNAMQTVFSVERNRSLREMRPFTRFWRKLCVISILLEIFRRLNAISIAFYTPNAMKTVLASKGTVVCESCHFLDFEENCALFRYCWRYFAVQTLFPLHFTPRTLRTPVSLSKGTDVCEKCDHLRDFEENCALFRYCWRYFAVQTLFPLHFTPRTLRTPVSSSKWVDVCAKCDHFLDLEENCALYRYCWGYFDV